jgi:hypothetical protein
MHKTIVAGIAIAALTPGCGDGALDGTLGEIGEGVFRYDCVADGDARCNTTNAVDATALGADLGIDPELPGAVAVGARFDLSYLGDYITGDGDPLFLDVVSARKDVVSDSGGFIVEEPGTYAFLAHNPQGYVADFVHLDAVAISELEIWHEEQRKNEVELVELGETNVAVVASSDRPMALAGGLGYAWSSSDDTIVGIDSVGSIGTPNGVEINDDEIRVVALAAGTAILTVSVDGISKELTVTVTAAPPEGNP